MTLRWQTSWYISKLSETDILRAYVIVVENQLRAGLISWVEEFEEHVRDAGDYIHVTHVYDGLDDDTWSISTIYDDYFPQLHRRSVFLTLYSLFEEHLNQLCNFLKKRLNLSLGFTGIAGKGIDRAKTYSAKVAGLDLVYLAESDTWQEVKNLKNQECAST